MPEHFRKFSQQIYAGGAPSAEDLRYMRDILGVRTVLSLDHNIASKIAPFLESLGMEQISIPIDPGSNSINASIRQLQQRVVNILSSKQPIYVHCLHGSDRTGLALAMYRILRDNTPYKQAIAEARKYGFGLGISPQIQKLWQSFLATLDVDNSSVEDQDIVGYMRDFFDMGSAAPAFNPQQSFAPETDIDPAVFHAEDARWQRQQERQKKWEELAHQVPMVGQFNNLGPMRGFGPVENSGMMTLI